jgi:uncharacterized tellurite resistance protein B-like protein
MFNFFKKKRENKIQNPKKFDFDNELTASILAYEVARSDGDISEDELNVLYKEIKKISKKVTKSDASIFKIIEQFSQSSVSFYEFIEDINKNYSKEDKLSLIKFLWQVAYADKVLKVNEERLIRRIADLIKIKDIDVLKLKHISKNSNNQ